jgi:cytochrome c oxidase assembly protein subunit 15
LRRIRATSIMTPTAPNTVRAIRLWLLTVAVLVFALVLVGGTTRMTESGLSIVEWKPVTGTLPPLSSEAWQAEFEKYQTIPQYAQRNFGMSLEQFKTIFWWEWAHRFLGRLVGVAFLLPFLWFLWRGWVPRGMKARLWGLFALGGLQGAVGWWMVASGLVERTDVSQYRLATHLTLASFIFAALIWTALRLQPSEAPPAPSRVRNGAGWLVFLVLFQIYLGALVAGLDAGLIYNTWPLIDGSFVPHPDRLFFETPAWRNLFENTLTVQFNHRMMAYLLWIVVVLHALDTMRALRRGPAVVNSILLAVAVTVQAVIGIMTLLAQAPIGFALLHQGMAMIVLAIAVAHAAMLSPRRERAAEAPLSPPVPVPGRR